MQANSTKEWVDATIPPIKTTVLLYGELAATKAIALHKGRINKQVARN